MIKKITFQIKVFSFCLFFSLFSFNTFAQVGIGTTDPMATLHVKGDYVPPVTSIQPLFEENFETWSIGPTGTSIISGTCTTTQRWEIRNTSTISNNRICSTCAGKMLYLSSDGCTLDATVVVPFRNNPDLTAIEVTISLRSKIVYSSDKVTIRLLNNTTNGSTVIGTVSRGDLNPSWTVPIVGGNDYSLEFHYEGEDGAPLTIDNIKVSQKLATSPASYAFRIDDNNAQPGYVLTSDGYGNASWKSPTGLRPANSDSSQLDINTVGSSSDENKVAFIHELQQAVRERQALIGAREEKIAEMEEALRRKKLKDE